MPIVPYKWMGAATRETANLFVQFDPNSSVLVLVLDKCSICLLYVTT